MAERRDVQHGTLALMILKTLDVLGPLHGYGIARRIEETSRHQLAVNYGTLYPALLKLQQEGSIRGAWGMSENNRKAKVYTITAAGKRHLAHATQEWKKTSAVMASFLTPSRGSI